MSRRIDPSFDLRLGLRAYEVGAVDRDQLLSAIEAWARSRDRTLGEALAAGSSIDETTLARLEASVADDLGFVDGDGPDRATAFHAAVSPSREGVPAPTATYDQPPGLEAGDDPVREGGGRLGLAPEPGRYRILRPHARGGLGEVSVAHDRQLDRTVALKELQPRLAHDPASQSRFLLEAEITGRLEHPGVVPIYSLGRHPDGRPFYAMPLIRGGTLRAAIERYHAAGPAGGGRDRDFRRLLRSVIDACNAVAYAHSRGVVHRDLKPENVMLGRFGETLVVDWGVAKLVEGDRGEEDEAEAAGRPAPGTWGTRPGSLVGTPRFMSPEQAASDLERVGPASDVYGLGAILYTILVGHDPFPDGDLATVLDRVSRGIFPSPRRLRRSVDPALEAICLRAMATDPAGRYASPLELAGELEAWLTDVRYRREQELALDEARSTLARLCLERAHACFGRAEDGEGMLWLARALEHAPPEPPDLQRAIRTSLSGWLARTRQPVRTVRHGPEIRALAFCPAGRRLATASAAGEARIWDLSTGMALASTLQHGGPIRAIAFAPGGALVATGGDEGLILLWDVTTGTPVGDPIRVGVPVEWLAFSEDGSRIAAAGPGCPFRWSASTGRDVPESRFDGPRGLAMATSPDGCIVAIGRDDGRVGFHDSSTGLPSGEPLDHGSPVMALEFGPAGTSLATGGVDGTVRLWDLERRVAVAAVAGPGRLRCLAFRPGGESFVWSGDAAPARLRDTTTGRPIGEPLDRLSGVDCLAFSPDGAILATGGADGMVRLWCAATGLPVGPAREHGGAIRVLAFSLDGRRLASGGPGTSAHCWAVPDPVEGDAERVSFSVRVATDLEFDDGDAVRRMDLPTSWELRRRLDDLGGPIPSIGPPARRPAPAGERSSTAGRPRSVRRDRGSSSGGT